MITPSGYAEITRKVEGKWIERHRLAADGNIKRKTGSNNMLRVETNGDTITAYVNDQKFATVKGQAPEGGGQIGMRAQSEKNQVDTWKFSALKVTDLPAPASSGDRPPSATTAPPAARPTAAPAPATAA